MKKELNTKQMIKNANGAMSEKAQNAVKQSKPVVGIVYNPKAIKINFSKKATLELSTYYAIKTQLFNVARVYSNNIKVYQKRIDTLYAKEELSLEDKELLNSTLRNIQRSQVCYRYYRTKINKLLKPCLGVLGAELYQAYCNRFMQPKTWKEEVEKALKGLEVVSNDTIFNFLDKNIGSKSTSVNKLDKSIIDNLSVTSFNKLFLDCLLQLAIDKNTLSRVVIRDTLEDKEIDIEEFKDIIVIDRVNEKTTIKEYQALFNKIGVDFKGFKKKEDYYKAYNKAKRDGLFAEM